MKPAYRAAPGFRSPETEEAARLLDSASARCARRRDCLRAIEDEQRPPTWASLPPAARRAILEGRRDYDEAARLLCGLMLNICGWEDAL